MINPYNPWVGNKHVGDGKQSTVIWHVDDLMASCVVDFKLTQLLCYLTNIYGLKLTMHLGHKYEYLGVDLEFREDRKLNKSMINYLKEVIKGFPEQIVGRAATPAGERLIDIQYTRRQRSKISGGGTSNSISSYKCAIVIYGNASATRHSNDSGLSDHESVVTRQG